MSLARRFTPALGALFAAVVAAALLIGPASPAQAHDGLASSDPIADSVLDVAPVAITLTFTNDSLGGASATAVIVNDASGAQVQMGDPVIDGPVVTQALSPTALSGAFLVTWRVVSSDGHPISGEFSYTVNAPAPAPTASTSTSPEPSAAPSESASAPSETPSATASGAPTSEGGSADYTPWGIAALVALVLSAITAAAVLLRRRSASRGGSSSSDNNSTPDQSSKG